MKLRRIQNRQKEIIPKLNCLTKRECKDRPLIKNSRYFYTNDISGISGLSNHESPVIPIRRKHKYISSSDSDDEKKGLKSRSDKLNKKTVSTSRIISKIINSSSSTEKTDLKNSAGDQRRLIKLISKLNKNLEITEGNLNLE